MIGIVRLCLITFVDAVADNFGLNFTECGTDYFRPGAEWVLQELFPDTVRL